MDEQTHLDLEARVESESQTVSRTSNDDLVCKDCLLRYPDNVILGNTSRCEAYPKPGYKPNSVMLGGQCDEYVQE